ncbi:hypothetical protein [Sphaerobacter thermophilus]|uniref:hypothetical protein n=1 Tax=Sphaerobacter thermophilus TaxID=2057 RepID=UPI0039C22A02
MGAYILRRIVSLIPVLLLVSIVAFALMHLTPGDPVAGILGEDATAEEIERVRQQLGLDRPIYEQYIVRLWNAVRGDLAEASLSFLGVGSSPEVPSWGNMLNEARQHMRRLPGLALYPGLAIMLTVLSLNLLGDGLRDVLDPHVRDDRGAGV